MIKKLAVVLLVAAFVSMPIWSVAETCFGETDGITWTGGDFQISYMNDPWTMADSEWDESFEEEWNSGEDWDEATDDWTDDSNCDLSQDSAFTYVTVTTSQTADVRRYATSDSDVIWAFQPNTKIEVLGLYISDDGEIWAETIVHGAGFFDTGYVSVKSIKEGKKLPKLTDKVVVKEDCCIFDTASGSANIVGFASKGDSYDVWCYLFDGSGNPWASCFNEKESEYIGCIPWSNLKIG